jgi:hypothetical protein
MLKFDQTICMRGIADQMEKTVNDYLPQLKSLDETRASLKPSAKKWSKKEILGHLVDSAQNNLRRFIVAQYENNPKITYQQDEWVRINNYQTVKLEELVQLWHLQNRQIIAVLRNTDPGLASRTCDTGELHSIEWLATDYIKHMKHHLHQVLELEEIAYP